MAVHPNPILFRKLQEAKQLPITEQVKRWVSKQGAKFNLELNWGVKIVE